MKDRRGVVYLVGAGPGDPELITVKGLRLLRAADVVVHDRLIGEGLLHEVRDDAELIDVGKFPEHHRIDQQRINEILVQRASAGLAVVRLKGGDPFVFGRGIEELEACRDNDIECQVVPGISSAIAAPASVGIPVTSRGLARSFAVVTAQTDPNLPEYDLDFAALAKIDTVVFLMGRKNLGWLADSLVAAGRSNSLPVTCIQEATMPGQMSVTGTLGNIAARAEEANLSNPMVTVVGHVAAMVDGEMRSNVGAVDRRQR